MLSKTQSKYIRSLASQKFREEYKCYIAEGEKIVGEYLRSNEKIEYIFGLEEWVNKNIKLFINHAESVWTIVSEEELKRISTLNTPNKCLIVVSKIERNQEVDKKKWCIALDAIRDPGNMGTILRIADWFGIPAVVCSTDCVDPFSPKVVQAAMGAHLRVSISEKDLVPFLKNCEMPSFAAILGGRNIYELEHFPNGVIIIGNEAKGVNEELLKIAQHKITIPRIGGAESLNAGVSAGIICSLLLKP